jgi:hypothetical protein
MHDDAAVEQVALDEIARRAVARFSVGDEEVEHGHDFELKLAIVRRDLGAAGAVHESGEVDAHALRVEVRVLEGTLDEARELLGTTALHVVATGGDGVGQRLHAANLGSQRVDAVLEVVDGVAAVDAGVGSLTVG